MAHATADIARQLVGQSCPTTCRADRAANHRFSVPHPFCHSVFSEKYVKLNNNVVCHTCSNPVLPDRLSGRTSGANMRELGIHAKFVVCVSVHRKKNSLFRVCCMCRPHVARQVVGQGLAGTCVESLASRSVRFVLIEIESISGDDGRASGDLESAS